MPQKPVQVNKFLGLNESADSLRELQLGEASKTDNFQITDGSNITLRPGVSRAYADSGRCVALWSGYIKDSDYLIAAIQHPEEGYTDCVISRWEEKKFEELRTIPIYHSYGETVIKIFPFFSKVYFCAGDKIWAIDFLDGVPYCTPQDPYYPVSVTGASPDGGGTALDNLNILSDFARIEYSSDGEAVDYILPEIASAVKSIVIDNVIVQNAGTFHKDEHKFTFSTAPAKGVNNVEITYEIGTGELLDARTRWANMRFWEAYNGTTDSRLFFYGDGSNVAYYTGVTDGGRGSALYVPAANEITVDMSDSPITGATRHYNKLLFFKPDCTAVVTYEPITLVDGSTIAGFTMKTVSRDVGNTPYGKIPVCANYPRTICDGNLYEWRLPSAFASDERYSKNITAKIKKSLASADARKLVVCDDSFNTTYYIFLNDEKGTVLVNRYNLDTWTIYRSTLFRDVTAAAMYGDTLVFAGHNAGEASLYYLDKSSRYDAPEAAVGAAQPIKAAWHTGYMDFSAENLKKYSSTIWVSVLPEPSSSCDITASTDRRDSYTVKEISANVFNYGNINYRRWTYNGNHSPVIRKIKLKVKKFVYYKMIFEINEPGATTTILGYDQQIRYGSEVK